MGVHSLGSGSLGDLREMHLVDVENLLGDPRFSASAVGLLRPVYARVARIRGDAQVVIGASSAQTLLEGGLGWPAARRVWRAGCDGADLALLEVGWTEHLPQRFDRVVIGSGDGIFATLAAALQAEGCEVTVVSRAASLSRQLRLAVRDVRILPAPSRRSAWLRGAA